MARPRATDLPGIEGPGVAPVKIKELERLGDKFIEIRDEKAELASKLTKLEAQMAEIMEEHKLTKYQFSDQEIAIKKGKVHIKIKSVKAEGVEVDPDGEP
jgi:hypothetical protein